MRGRRRRGRPDDRAGLGRTGPDRGRARVRLVQLRGAGLQDRQSGDTGQRRSRRGPGRAASCASSSASIRTNRCRRCAAISTGTASRMVRDRAARDEIMSSDARSTPTTPGCDGRSPRSPGPAARSRRCCPTSAARCPTTSSPTCLGLRTSGCRTPTRPARSTRPNEHLPAAIAREGLAMMAGLYWDLAEPGVPAKA